MTEKQTYRTTTPSECTSFEIGARPDYYSQGGADFWSCDEDEVELSHECMGDAIGEYLDNIDCPVVDLPKTTTVYGFRRVCVRDRIRALSIIDGILEPIECDHGDPYSDRNPVTDTMRQAEKVFLDVLSSEYESWACVMVKTETFNTQEWIEENAPEWYDDQ